MTTKTIPEYLEAERRKDTDTQRRTEEEAASIQARRHGQHRIPKPPWSELPAPIEAVVNARKNSVVRAKNTTAAKARKSVGAKKRKAAAVTAKKAAAGRKTDPRYRHVGDYSWDVGIQIVMLKQSEP
jgi:hypothetical protein